MPNVSAPYNFIPLNEDVFFPPWANFVNHDIPFKEGLSGKIDLKITAESPIFIRKPYEKGDKCYPRGEYKISKEFCHIKNSDGSKRYYIPGSSIRNMLRSVVEIMSFSKLNFINKTEKFGFRDMANPNLYKLRYDANNLSIGWLYKDDEGIKIKKTGVLGSLRDRNNPNTIPHTDDKFNTINNFNTVSISEKYILYNILNSDSATNFSVNTLDPIIVITGNIRGKSHEFKFNNPNTITSFLKVTDKQHANFTKAYDIKKESNENWKFWKPIFDKGKYLPVFFRENNGQIIDFGLTVLYKMLHKNDLEDIIIKQQPNFVSSELDFTETIFGSIENEKLKGRVLVSHAFSDNAEPANNEFDLVLGKPKNSFYPFYIEQNVDDNSILVCQNNQFVNYNTLSDNGAKISGRKRYPVHYRFNPNHIKPLIRENDNNVNPKEKVNSLFIPIKEEGVFNTKLIYHNLLPVELGAIISAITFHNSSECRHNIGQAKPYGFGRIQITITNIDEVTQKNYMGLYQQLMTDFDEDWLKSDQITELCSMAFVSEDQKRNKLKYMPLAEFQNIKKRNGDNTPKALPLYSKFMGIIKTPEFIKTNSNLDKIFISNANKVSELKNGLAKYLLDLDEAIKSVKKKKPLKQLEMKAQIYQTLIL